MNQKQISTFAAKVNKILIENKASSPSSPRKMKKNKEEAEKR
jgi:hypothetical protein